jgi:hypothetical protein
MTSTARAEPAIAAWIGLVLAALAIAWAGAIVAAPRLASGGGGRIGTLGAAVVYAFGSGVCHQRPERSLVTAGTDGRSAGAARDSTSGRRWASCSARSPSGGTRAMAPARWRGVIVAAAVPTATSWLLEVVGGPATPVAWRAVLAAPAGFVLGGSSPTSPGLGRARRRTFDTLTPVREALAEGAQSANPYLVCGPRGSCPEPGHLWFGRLLKGAGVPADAAADVRPRAQPRGAALSVRTDATARRSGRRRRPRGRLPYFAANALDSEVATSSPSPTSTATRSSSSPAC